MTEFKNAMQAAGITPPENIIADGNIHRFHIKGDKYGTTNGWYILFNNPLAGVFGCWKRDIKENWSSKNISSYTVEEKSLHQANMDAAKKQREAEQAIIHADCRKRSANIWQQAKPATTDHPYLINKGIKSYGLKAYKGSLAIQLVDSKGTIQGLQFIDKTGSKRFVTGTAKKGHYFPIGGNPKTVLYLAEGYATAATIYEATGEPVAVCFDAGNLKSVAKVMREKFPDLKLVICADNDRHTEGNPGLTKATEAAQAVNGLLAIPEFPEDCTGSDFNDLATIKDLAEVKKQINSARTIENQEASKPSKYIIVDIKSFLKMTFPPREYILAPWLPVQGIVMVYALRGVGKTHFSLRVAYAVASGGFFLNWEAERRRSVLFIDGEMPATVLQERISNIAVSCDKEPTASLNFFTPDLQPQGMLDLADPRHQQHLEPYLEGIDLIIVDNLSTLCRSGKENEGESWVPVQEWALRQRSAGKSVLFIHHAGKSGEQRGSSRREDVLDTVISLKRPSDYTPDKGACFEVHFEKARGILGDDTKPTEVMLTTDEDGKQIWKTKSLDQSTAEKVAALINEGVEQKDIPEILNLSKGAISKAKKKATEEGLISVSKKP